MSSAANVLVASAIAALSSLVLASVQGAFVPYVIEGTDVGARPPDQRVYTKEELDRAEREARARMHARIEDKSFEARALNLRSLQRPALWVSWLPWLLLPFLVAVKNAFHFALAMAVPALLVASTTSPPESLFVFGVALLVGIGAKYAYARARAT